MAYHSWFFSTFSWNTFVIPFRQVHSSMWSPTWNPRCHHLHLPRQLWPWCCQCRERRKWFTRNPCFHHQEKKTRPEVSSLDGWKLVGFPLECESWSLVNWKVTSLETVGLEDAFYWKFHPFKQKLMDFICADICRSLWNKRSSRWKRQSLCQDQINQKWHKLNPINGSGSGSVQWTDGIRTELIFHEYFLSAFYATKKIHRLHLLSLLLVKGERGINSKLLWCCIRNPGGVVELSHRCFTGRGIRGIVAGSTSSQRQLPGEFQGGSRCRDGRWRDLSMNPFSKFWCFSCFCWLLKYILFSWVWATQVQRLELLVGPTSCCFWSNFEVGGSVIEGHGHITSEMEVAASPGSKIILFFLQFETKSFSPSWVKLVETAALSWEELSWWCCLLRVVPSQAHLNVRCTPEEEAQNEADARPNCTSDFLWWSNMKWIEAMRYVYLKLCGSTWKDSSAWSHVTKLMQLFFSSVLASRKHFTIQVHFEDSGIGQETLPGSLCK